jgi:CRP/FNR family nitrogen fixation transcriptional regulator
MPFRIAIRPARPSPAAFTQPLCPVPPESLRAAGSVLHLAQGAEIFAQGEASGVLYRVISGVVRICKLFQNGRRQIEAFHVTGDVFGFELSACRSLYAEAASDCVLVSYHRHAIEALAEKDKSVHQQMLHHAVRNLAQAQAHALLLGRRGAVARLAAFLIDWASRLDRPETIALGMPRQDIADYLGLTIETVCRSLGQLERQGMIALPNARQVRILDEARLTKLAG